MNPSRTRDSGTADQIPSLRVGAREVTGGRYRQIEGQHASLGYGWRLAAARG